MEFVKTRVKDKFLHKKVVFSSEDFELLKIRLSTTLIVINETRSGEIIPDKFVIYTF